MSMETGTAVIAVIFLLIGLAIFLWGYSIVNTSIASTKWPSVTGAITNSWVNPTTSCGRYGCHSDFNAEVNYQYTVNGTQYTGSRVSLLGYSSPTDEGAVEYLAAYPVGGQVKVYYDPSGPGSSLLITGFQEVYLLLPGFGLLFMIIAIYIFVKSNSNYQPPVYNQSNSI